MKRDILLVLTCAVTTLSAIIIYFTIKQGHDWGDDFALYVNQTIHIVEDSTLNDLYEWNKISEQKSLAPLGPYLYPNGFPILLSIVYFVYGLDLLAMKYFCATFFILTIILIFHLFKHKFDFNGFFVLLLCSIALHYDFIKFSDNVLSDFPFLFFCLLAFCLFETENNIICQVSLGIVIFYAYFIKDIGIILLPTLITYQLFNANKYSKKQFLTYVPYLIFILFYVISCSTTQNGRENHLDLFFSKFNVNWLYDNLLYYLKLVSFYFSLGGSYSLNFALFIIFISFFGAVIDFRSNSHISVFTLLIFLILIVWQSRQHMRYIYPILPFLIFFFLRGLEHLFTYLKLNIKYSQAFISIALIVFLYKSTVQISYNINSDSNQACTDDMKQVYTYLFNINNPNMIIGFVKPRALFLFTKKKSIYTDADHFDESIATHLLIEREKITIKNQDLVIHNFKNYVLLRKK